MLWYLLIGIGLVGLLVGLDGIFPIRRWAAAGISGLNQVVTKVDAGFAFTAVFFLAISTIIGMLIAIIGLGLFHYNMNFFGIPGYFWNVRANPHAMQWLAIGLAGGMFLTALMMAPNVFKRTKLHGTARWANKRDARKAGLHSRSGILLGRAHARDLRLGGTEHVIVEAPTRAGKGVGVVIPNLLDWEGSAVILDVKQENYTATAGYRVKELGQIVYLIDPLNESGKTSRYNPLGYIRRDDPVNVIHEMQKVGIMLYPEPLHGDAFWLDMARTAFIGIGAYVAACADKPFTIGQIYREITGASSQKSVMRLVSRMEREGTPLSKEAASALSSYANNSDNTYAGIRSTVLSKINLWVNPYVDAATSESDFALEDLRLGGRDQSGNRRAISLYLGVSPNDIETIQPLYNLIVQQIIDRNVRELYDDERMYKVLVVLDEFARLGQSTILAQAFSYVAGYGLRLLPVVQSRSQLRAIYGQDVAKEIMTNCGAEVVFGVKEDDICSELERRIGYYTFKSESRSRKMSEMFDTSRSRSDQRRALMMAQEIRDMPPTDALIFRANTPAIKAKKIRYFKERRYMKRILPAPIVSAREVERDTPALPEFDDVNDETLSDTDACSEHENSVAQGSEDVIDAESREVLERRGGGFGGSF